MIKLLYGDFYSYERLRFTGLNTQNILNVATKNGIILKNVVRVDYAVLEADVYRRHLKKLKKLLGSGKYKIETLKRKGFSYKITSNVRRIFLWMAMVLSCVGLFLLFSRTWSVKVIGYDNLKAIESIVREYEMFDWRINAVNKIAELENAISRSDSNILWNSVSINGTVIEVYIREDDSVKYHQDSQGNIVAQKDCVIKNLIVTGGTPMVENGQTVSEGQVLIEASQKFGEQVFPVKAEGKAIASVWYYGSEEVPIKSLELVENGNTEEFFEVDFLGIKITTKRENDFEYFNQEKKEINTFFLPIKIFSVIQKETCEAEVQKSKDELIKDAEAHIINRLRVSLPENAEIYETKTNVEEIDGFLKIGVYIETVEDVAIRG